MKIGILTFHCAYNVGAMLQCYALQKHLQGFEGHQVKIINYRPSYLESRRPRLRIKQMILHPFSQFKYITSLYKIHLKRYEEFKKFEELFFVETSVATNLAELKSITSDFDIVILGSDQIWHKQFNGDDLSWFGAFRTGSKPILISYAASAGDNQLSIINKDEIKKLINRINYISVREQSLKDYLLNDMLLSKQIDVVLDPVLMVSISVWHQWFKPVRHDKYVAIREARPNPNTYRIAKMISEQINSVLITVDAHPSSKKKDVEMCSCPPNTFVSMIRNAQCVVTTSFHGVALSIISNTPFYALRLNDGQDKRIEDLLHNLGLEDRLLPFDATPIFSNIDYEKVNKKIDELRRKSQYFIENALGL